MIITIFVFNIITNTLNIYELVLIYTIYLLVYIINPVKLSNYINL